MGEYATLRANGARIKIGTCESMYYLRADQANKVEAEKGNVDPAGDRFEIRFRFPFPDEDLVQPGDFEDYNRAVRVDGITAFVEVEHYEVQFTAPNGYLLSLPCPENCDDGVLSLTNGAEVPYRVARNGWGGAVGIHSQRWVVADEHGPERLVTVCRCLACGALYRLHAWADAEPVVVALRAMADKGNGVGTFLHGMADRMAHGYEGRTS